MKKTKKQLKNFNFRNFQANIKPKEAEKFIYRFFVVLKKTSVHDGNVMKNLPPTNNTIFER